MRATFISVESLICSNSHRLFGGFLIWFKLGCGLNLIRFWPSKKESPQRKLRAVFGELSLGALGLELDMAVLAILVGFEAQFYEIVDQLPGDGCALRPDSQFFMAGVDFRDRPGTHESELAVD